MAASIKLDYMGGVNLLQDARRIGENEARLLRNLIPVAPGMLGKRKGTVNNPDGTAQFFFGSVGASQVNVAPTGMFACPDARLPRFLYAGKGTDDTLGEVAIIKAVTGSAFQWPAAPLRSPQFVYFVDKIYIFAGLGSGFPAGAVCAADPSGSGGFSISTFNFSGTNNTYSPGVACGYRARMVYGDFGSGRENYLVYSDAYAPDVIGNDVVTASNGRAVKVGDDGERITAIIDVMLTDTGDPAQSALLVLKERSAYLLTGEPDETAGGPSTLTVNKLSISAGCVGHQAVTRTPYGIFWADKDDVWMFRAGAIPQRVGTKLRPRLKETPIPEQHRWHMAYHAGFLRLAIFAPGQDAVSVPVANTRFLTRCGEQWFMDLREKELRPDWTPTWFGPQVFSDPVVPNDSCTGYPTDTPPVGAVYSGQGTYAMAVDSQSDTLVGVTANLIEAYALLYTFDVQDGYDETAPLANFAPLNVPIDDQFDNEISIAILGKDSDMDSPVQDKVIQRLEGDVSLGFPTKLAANYYSDGGAGGLKSLYLPGDLPLTISRSGFVADVNIARGLQASADNVTREFTQFVAYPPAGTRPASKRIQLAMTETAGYVVDSTNDKLTLQTTGPVVEYTFTAVHGHYATLQEFIDAFAGPLSNIASQNHGLITFSLGGTSWKPIFVATGTITAANAAISTLVWDLFGLDVTAAYAFALTHTTTSPVRWRQSGFLELSNIFLQVRLNPRRPT